MGHNLQQKFFREVTFFSSLTRDWSKRSGCKKGLSKKHPQLIWNSICRHLVKKMSVTCLKKAAVCFISTQSLLYYGKKCPRCEMYLLDLGFALVCWVHQSAPVLSGLLYSGLFLLFLITLSNYLTLLILCVKK